MPEMHGSVCMTRCAVVPCAVITCSVQWKHAQSVGRCCAAAAPAPTKLGRQVSTRTLRRLQLARRTFFARSVPLKETRNSF